MKLLTAAKLSRQISSLLLNNQHLLRWHTVDKTDAGINFIAAVRTITAFVTEYDKTTVSRLITWASYTVMHFTPLFYDTIQSKLVTLQRNFPCMPSRNVPF